MDCPPGTLSVEQRRKLLEELTKRKFAKEVAKDLGISRASLYRYLKGEREPPPDLDPKLCESFEEDEILGIIDQDNLLAAAGLIKEGKLNTPLAIAITNALLDDPVARDIILKQVAKKYKNELQDLLNKTLPKIKLEWTGEFEQYLTKDKSKPISEKTLRDYKRLFNACLKGVKLDGNLIQRLKGKKTTCKDGKRHSSAWLRQIVRHYIRYLYAQGELDWDSYTRLLMKVPGRRYGRKLAQKPILLEDVRKSLELVRERRRDIYTVYLLLVYSGARFLHVLDAINNWNPDEILYVEYLARNIKRLECLGEHCRYYLGRESERKPVGFMFFPRQLLPMIEEIDRLPNRRRVEKIVKKKGALPPKYIRIFALREMKKVFGDNDTYRFIVSKFGELTVSARHYMDLLGEADKIYPKYVKHINGVLGNAITFNLKVMP
jgi:intergrase/recombinase